MQDGFGLLLPSLLGRLHPAGIVAAALFFGLLDNGADALEFSNFPHEVSDIVKGLIVLLILALTMCTVDLIVMHSYAAAASALQRVLRDPVWQRRQNHVFGGLLMLIGAALLFVRRTPATAAVS